MSEQNVDRLRVRYEALSRNGEWPEDGLLAPGFEVHQDSVVDTAQVFVGADAPRQALGTLEKSFNDVSVDAEKFIEAPEDQVVVLVRVRGRGRASGIGIDRQMAHVCTFRDDRLVRVMIYERPAEALKALGISA